MADENVMEMEARLKDFVSSQLSVIQNNMNSFSKEGQKSFQTLSNQIKENEKSFVSMFAKIGGGLLGAQQLISFTKSSIAAFQEQEQANIQLEARLKATGFTSGFTADQLKKMADELQRTTKFSDDTIQSAQTMLLAFDNLSGESFPQALDAAMGLSVALGTDLKSAAQQVGIALEKPEDAGRKLRSMSIILSDAQEELIKNLVKTGESSKAQAIILGEMQKLYGGLAQSSVTAEQIMSNKWAEFKESMGEFLITPIRIAIGLFDELSDKSKKQTEESIDAQIAAIKKRITEIKTMSQEEKKSFDTNVMLMQGMTSGIATIKTTTDELVKLNSELTSLQNKQRAAEEARAAAEKSSKDKAAAEKRAALDLAGKEAAKKAEEIEKNQEEVDARMLARQLDQAQLIRQLKEEEKKADDEDAAKKKARDKAIIDANKVAMKEQLTNTVDNLRVASTQYRQFGGVFKSVAHAQNMISTYEGATHAFTSLAKIPYVGPILGAAAAAAAVAAGIARGAMINAQKFETGGFPVGSNALIRVNERGQEAILNAQAVRTLGSGVINDLNAGRISSTGRSFEINAPISINISGNVDRGVMQEIGMNLDQRLQALARDIKDIEYRRIKP